MNDTDPTTTGPATFVWQQEDAVFSGDVHALAKAVEMAHYSDLSTPEHIITLHHDTWADVSVRVAHHGTDEQDWMYYKLTCSWADRNESAFFSIDGRA